MKNLLTRFISGLVVLLIIFLMHFYSEYFLLPGVIILSTFMLVELKNAFKNKGISTRIWIAICLNLLYIAVFYANSLPIIIFLILFTVICGFFQIIFLDSGKISIGSSQLFINIYISLFMSHLLFFKGSVYAWLIYIIAFGTDTFSYLLGSLFGKHKLIPKVSPQKTIEGAIGGIIGSILLAMVFSMLTNQTHIREILLISAFGAIVSQIGDLTASQIKRMVGIKDYGKIIPGHGGILDRFDSVLIVAPFLYWMLYFNQII